MKHVFFGLIALTALTISCNDTNKSDKADKAKSKKEETSEIDSLPPTKVATTVTKQKTFNREIISNGKLQAHKEAQLRFKLNKPINTINISNGDYVHKGALVADLQYYEGKKQVMQNRVQLENARIKLMDLLISQGYSLKDTSEIPDNILETAKIKSGYIQAKNNLELARYKYQRRKLKAPISGIVANLHTKEHMYPDNSRPFCTIIDTTQFEVQFPIMESEIALISPGQKVEIIPYFKQSIKMTGTIKEINPQVDKNGLITAVAIIDSPPSEVFEGMNVKVFIQKEVEEALVIPKKAVTLRSERQVVFVYDNGKALWNYVQTGLENQKEIIITKGIQSGDSVIVEGNANLGHKAEVQLQ